MLNNVNIRCRTEFREENGIVVILKVKFCEDKSKFSVSSEAVVLQEWTTDLCSDPEEPHLITVVQSASV